MEGDGVVGKDEYSKSMLLQSPARQGYSGGDLVLSWKSDERYICRVLLHAFKKTDVMIQTET